MFATLLSLSRTTYCVQHIVVCRRCLVPFIVRHTSAAAGFGECVQVLCMFTLYCTSMYVTEEFLLTFASLLSFPRTRCCALGVFLLLLYVTEDFLLICTSVSRFCVCSPCYCTSQKSFCLRLQHCFFSHAKDVVI